MSAENFGIAQSESKNMDKEAALDFLRTYQPMPPDTQMPGELIETYNEVRRYFIANPDKECIDLFLNSFGDGSGFGVYQLIDEVLRQYPKSEVVPRLARCLRSQRRSVRYWCAEMAASFPEPDLVEPLSNLIQEEDADMRSSALTALFTVADKRVSPVLQASIERETDLDLRQMISDALEYRQKHKIDIA